MALSNTFYFLDCAFIISKCFAGVNREFFGWGGIYGICLVFYWCQVVVLVGGLSWWSFFYVLVILWFLFL